MDLAQIFGQAFPILQEIEGNPSMDILKRRVANTLDVDPHAKNQPYIEVATHIPCVFSVASARTDLGDDVINTNTSFYVLRSNIVGIPLTESNLIRFKGDLYKIVTGGVLENFGVLEIRVMRGNNSSGGSQP